MEVTPEMIEAVKAHQTAEYRRKADEASKERLRKYQEATARIMAETLAEARKILPGLTEQQLDELTDVFSEHQEKMDYI